MSPVRSRRAGLSWETVAAILHSARVSTGGSSQSTDLHHIQLAHKQLAQYDLYLTQSPKKCVQHEDTCMRVPGWIGVDGVVSGS